MGKLILKGRISSDLKETEYGYYFSIAEDIGKLRVQFHNCFLSEILADDMRKKHVKKGSLIELIAYQSLSVYEKDEKKSVNSKLNVIHWEFAVSFHNNRLEKDAKSQKTISNSAEESNMPFFEINLEDDELPY